MESALDEWASFSTRSVTAVLDNWAKWSNDISYDMEFVSIACKT